MAVGRRKVVSRTKAETTKPLPSSAISTEGHDMYTNNDDGSLFWKWANHQDTSFHRFTLLEATAIRDALLHWYRANRRKLPWRGDPPPYDGSTAGIATSTAAKAAARIKKKSKKHDDNTTPNKGQTSLLGFFPAKGSTADQLTKVAVKHNAINNSNVVEDGDQNPSSSQSITSVPPTAYGVWVSEIMLQQTRVEAVIPYWIQWMKSFPTVEDLAMASEDEVNAHWAGLGFYRRARLLHQGAKYVVKELQGTLPTTASDLQQIGGIGPYTAAAIASIAFDECVPVVDGNVCRVLSRLRGICQHIKAPVFKDRYAWDLAKQIVEAGNGQHAGEVNQALMELGATYCAPAASGMDDRDPLKPFYMSTKLAHEYALLRNNKSEYNVRLEQALNCDEKIGCKVCDSQGIRMVVENLSELLDDTQMADLAAIGKYGHSVFPMAPPKSAKREEVLAVLALKWSQHDSISEDRWLLVKRPKSGLLAGQWEFPSVCVWTSDDQTLERGQPRKDMSTQVPVVDRSERSKALTQFLEELSPRTGVVDARERYQLEVPIEHIFSHVRHTMWIEVALSQQADNDEAQLQWISPGGKEVRWMSDSDMKLVGVTSGVKRIIKTVNQKKTTGISLKSKKRKR